ncbi:MAG: CBS domain-containing protein [Candidatus Anammoxibacter sp.]
MLIRYFMTRDVITLSPEQTCKEARDVFKQNNIRRAPVLHHDRLVGIVSEHDLLRTLPGTVGQLSTTAGLESMDIQIRNIMKTNLQTINRNDHIEMAARLMLRYKIGGIPVVDKGKLCGIITESDIFKVMWMILAPTKGYRILFLDEGKDTDKISIDYVGLCMKYRCKVQTFIRYANPDGGYMCYLCIEGGSVDSLIEDLWSHSCKVITIENDGHPLD